MVALQERFNDVKKALFTFWLVFAPAETFLSQGSVEALDMRLLVFLVRTCDAMMPAVVPHLHAKPGFKLTAAIGWHNPRKAVEAPSHAAVQKSRAVGGG